MRADFPVFVGVAVLLHIAIAFALPKPEGGAMTGGEGGEDAASITAASATTAAMVEEWERPPELEEPVSQAQPEPVEPETTPPEMAALSETLPPTEAPQQVQPDAAEAAPQMDTEPVLQESPVSPSVEVPPAAMAPAQLPATPDLPQVAALPETMRPTLPEQPRATPPAPAEVPDIDTANAEPQQPKTAPDRSIRPRKMPQRPEPPVAEAPKPEPKRTAQPARKQATQQARPAQETAPARAGAKSAGSGGSSQAGIAKNAGARQLSASQKQNLMAQWGAQIRSRIERRKRSPGGRGRVVMRISVAASGQVTGVGIVRSSGNARLDRAALQAVRSAGRMPRAPKQLGGGTQSFNLPMDFN
ncbi:energy transducer TonB [Vannielia litorea]|uniref:energy transducer TonB family protein n=1 Tax=Vannielia litorea TaxID=1217970 RepID=UPI001C9452E1|nr:energy transducer TonB [Vannielia litorea]MBY6048461.1 TonB family protein [Vannielia litorea]MBY6075875.1 TonB family protein [Vannielia litorea]